MELFIIWLAIFIISLAALIKAADWLTEGISHLIGRLGSTAEAGVVAVSLGTTLPELAVAAAAVFQGKPDLAVWIAIGSSIANILLVVGIGAISARSLSVKKEHIDLDLPLFCASIAIFFFVSQSGQADYPANGRIDFWEGFLMVAAFFAYAIYVLAQTRDSHNGVDPNKIITPELLGDSGNINLTETISTRWEKVLDKTRNNNNFSWEKAVFLSLGGVALLVVAANFVVDSLLHISDIIMVPAGIAAVTVMAIGVALPELLGALALVRKKRYEMMMGNVFGATTINLLLVCGAAALMAPLEIDAVLANVGIPFLIASAVLLAVSTFARRINSGEGIMYLFLYFLFLVKLFNLF